MQVSNDCHLASVSPHDRVIVTQKGFLPFWNIVLSERREQLFNVHVYLFRSEELKSYQLFFQ